MKKPKLRIGDPATVKGQHTGTVAAVMRINSSWAYKVMLASGEEIEATENHVA